MLCTLATSIIGCTHCCLITIYHFSTICNSYLLASAMSNDYELSRATVEDLDFISKVEASSFPRDEAASAATIRERQKIAGKYFIVMKARGTNDCIGFINGTCITGDTVTEESMTEHVAQGSTLVVHSVTISPEHRRHGFGSLMLKKYVTLVAKQCPEITRLLLLSKAYLLAYYVSCGFQLVRLSPVLHGEENWFEMRIDPSDYRTVEQYQVDAFADRAFSGNPAAVVFEHREESWMQSVAAENNLAETAFLRQREGTEADFDIRWFTPLVEVELCGHATLASAHAIYDSERVKSRDIPLRFFTNFGAVLTAEGKENGLIELNFPATPPAEEVYSKEDLDNVIKGFSITVGDILYTGRTIYDRFIEITASSFSQLGGMDFEALAKLGGRGVILTCKGDGLGHDFTSRFFGPNCGIDEDSVTGSAHCALAPYWFQKLAEGSAEDSAKLILSGYQASKRGGTVHAELSDSGSRVLLSGSSVTVIKSKLFV